jgi:predicted dehydrogenase
MRVAILGAGLMGRWHACYARRCGAQIAGILDRDGDRAARLASQYAARPFTDAAALLAEAHPQAVHICTPTATHAQLAEFSIDAGAHVLMEKPLAASAAECERLLDSAERRGVQLCPVHQFAFQNGARQAALWAPALGHPQHVQATICSAGGAGMNEAQLDRTASEILPHPLSLIALLWPDGARSWSWSAARPAAGEIRASGSYDAASAFLSISLSGRPTECSLRITGPGGGIYLDLFHGFAVREPPGVSRLRKALHPFDKAARELRAAAVNLAGRAVRRESAYPGLVRLIAQFYASAEGTGPAPFTRQNILAVSRWKDEIAAAALGGVTVR